MSVPSTRVNDNPDVRALRQFGALMAGAIALVFGLAIPWLWDLAWPRWPWAAAGVFAVWAALWPTGLAPVYQGWMKVAHVLGWINTRLLLGLVFYGVIAPMGLIMRLLGHDPLRRRREPERHSYRTDSRQSPPNHMEKPY